MGFYPTLQRGNRRFGLNERAGDSYGMDPGTVYSQSLYMWYRASDLPLSHSQKVLSWQGFTGNPQTSQSSFIMTAVAASAPEFRTGSFGSDMSGLYCDGTTKYVQFSARQNITPSMVNYTVIWFGRWAPLPNFQSIWSDPFSTGFGNYIYNSGSYYSYEGIGSFWYLNSTGSQTRMITYVSNAGFAQIYDNGVQCALYSQNGRSNSQYLYILGSYSSNLFQGYIGEFMVINAVLTQPQIMDMYNNYFKIKYRNDPTLT